MHPRVSRWHQRDFTTCPSQRTQVRLDMPSAALGQTHTGRAEGPQAVCSTQGGLAPAQEGRGGGASSRIRGFPEPLAMATPPTDFQQGLGLRVRVQNTLVALGLGKEGRGGWAQRQVQGDKGHPDSQEQAAAPSWFPTCENRIKNLLLPQGKQGGALALSLGSPHPGPPSLGGDKGQGA